MSFSKSVMKGLKAMTPREMMVMPGREIVPSDCRTYAEINNAPPVHSPARFQGYLASLRALPESIGRKSISDS